MRNFILHSLLGVILIALSSCGHQALEQVSFASAEDPFQESLPEVQTWEVDASEDQLLTGSAGTQLLLPAGSLLDASGDPATGNVKVELSEAVQLDEMLFANLTTTSGDRLPAATLTETSPHSGLFRGAVPTASCATRYQKVNRIHRRRCLRRKAQ